MVIANSKKYLQSDWLRGSQYWPYLYSVFNICTFLLNQNKKWTFNFSSRKIEMWSLKRNWRSVINQKLSVCMYNYLKLVSAIFYQIFIFFTKWLPFKNFEECFLFHLKSSFYSRDIHFLVIFPFLSKLFRFKRTNASGIIYDIMNWLA